MVKLKDILNPKTNSRNHQVSFDLRKLKMQELDMDVEDILELNLRKKKN
jgi:hypothetical protein